VLRLSHHHLAQARIASGANVVLGIWLIASHWVFEYQGKSAVLSSMAVGILIALLAAIRVASSHDSASLSGVNLLLALWLVVSPWVYRYRITEGALLNNIIVGALIAGLAIWSAVATDAERRHGPDASLY
jgi:hypothetical protein